MNILGLHYGHDGAACIVKDGKLISAIASERITRNKKDTGVTKEVIDYVLSSANLSLEDIDAIALSDYFTDFNNGTLKLYKDGTQIDYTNNQIFNNDHLVVDGLMFGKTIPVYIIPHHMSHCASAYYTSNFNSSWCFSMDSSFGKIESNSLIAKGSGNKLVAVECPKTMIGVGYAMFTELLGLGSALHKAGTTMGLASYGNVSDELINNIDAYTTESIFSDEIIYIPYYEHLWQKWSGSKKQFQTKEAGKKKGMNLAADIQYLFEKSIGSILNKIDKDSENNLCLSGGSMLNCNANSYIKENTRFENIHHFPACGDDGISVGAALYTAHHIFDEPRTNYEYSDIAYLGKDYDYEEPDYEKVAKMIADGKIVAWFMGKSEYGPRALGNRSILADPRNFHNRELINFVVKDREWFRPFAPVVLEEESKNWFDFDQASPFMLYIAKVLKPEQIPAVTHIDGTARLQTVNEKTNPPYYRLIKEFEKISGVPVLINTSLNGNGEPILETEEQAIDFFNKTDIDAIVINGRLLIK